MYAKEPKGTEHQHYEHFCVYHGNPKELNIYILNIMCMYTKEPKGTEHIYLEHHVYTKEPKGTEHKYFEHHMYTKEPKGIEHLFVRFLMTVDHYSWCLIEPSAPT